MTVTRTVSNAGSPLTLPDGTLLANVRITFTLVTAKGVPIAVWDATTAERIADRVEVFTDESGEFEVELWPNSRGDKPSMYLCNVDYPSVADKKGTVTDAVGTLTWIEMLEGDDPLSDQELTALGLHVASTTAHAASQITVTPTGTMASTNVQAALAEIASEVVQLSGSYADPSWITSLSGTKIVGALTAATIAASALTGTALAATVVSANLNAITPTGGALTISGAQTVTGALTAASFIGPLTGNATTATALATSRNLWGRPFTGAADVSGAMTGVTDITASGVVTAGQGNFTSGSGAAGLIVKDAATTQGTVQFGSNVTTYNIHGGTDYTGLEFNVPTGGSHFHKINGSTVVTTNTAGQGITGVLAVSGNTTVGGTLGVASHTTLSGNVTVGQFVGTAASNFLFGKGAFNVLRVTPQVDASGVELAATDSTGAVAYKPLTLIGSALTLAADTTVSGDLVVTDTLGVTGATSTANITATTTSGYGLTVTTAANAFTGINIARTVNTASSWDIYTPAGQTDIRFFSGADKAILTTAGALTLSGGLSATTGAFSSTVTVTGNATGVQVNNTVASGTADIAAYSSGGTGDIARLRIRTNDSHWQISSTQGTANTLAFNLVGVGDKLTLSSSTFAITPAVTMASTLATTGAISNSFAAGGAASATFANTTTNSYSIVNINGNGSGGGQVQFQASGTSYGGMYGDSTGVTQYVNTSTIVGKWTTDGFTVTAPSSLNGVYLGNWSDATSYGVISFNGLRATTTYVGIGSSAATGSLYFDARGGAFNNFEFRVAGVDKMVVSSTGAAITGALSATQGITASGVAGYSVFVSNTTNSGVVGTHLMQRSGVAKKYIGLDAADNFAVLSSAGAAVVTVTEAGVLSAAGSVYITASGNIGSSSGYCNFTSAGAWIASSGANIELRVNGSGTAAATFDTSGNLLVGTTSAGAKFRVDQTGATATACLIGDNSGTPVAQIINYATSGDNGLIYFYTDAGATQRGSITYNRGAGEVAYNVTSDWRSKTILGLLTNVDDLIDALRPQLVQMHGGTMQRPAFVAHELQQVAPWAVTGTMNATDPRTGQPIYQQVNLPILIPPMVKYMQDTRAQVRSLTLTVADHEGRITRLEGGA
jgi:fibronectin-binding autotransporter adhesin